MKSLVHAFAVLVALSAYAAETTVSDDVQIEAGALHEINVAEGDTVTYSGVISGEGGVKKTGKGTLVLAGENTFSGGFNLVEGKVRADSSKAFGSAAVTNSTTTAGAQFVFNVANGVFENDFVMLYSKSNGSGDYPTLYFNMNTTMNGDVTLATETNFGSPNKSSIEVTFNGRILGGMNILYKIYGNAHFKSALKLKALYSGVVDSSSGTIHIYSENNSIPNGIILRKGSVKCHGRNVSGGGVISMRSTLGGTSTTFFDMNGFDQSVSHITFQSGTTLPSVSATGGQITSATPAILTITGTKADDAYMGYYGVAGQVSLVLDADPAFKQTFVRRKSATTGDINVKSGIFEMSEESTFANVPTITVGDGGTFLMNSTQSDALAGVTLLKVDGRFEVGESCSNPFGEAMDVELGDDAELSFPSDMKVFVASLRTNGVPVTGTVTPDSIPQLKSGTIVVKAQNSANVWVGGGASESIALAANWQSDVVDIQLGGMSATFASSDAAGFRAEVDEDVLFDKITLCAQDGFDFLGDKVLSVKNGIMAERPNEAASPVYSFFSPVDLVDRQTLSVAEGARMIFAKGVTAKERIGKIGTGTLGLSGSNVWSDAFIVSNGAVNITGTVTTPEGCDGSVISGKDVAGAISLHMSTQSGADANYYLTVSNAVIEKPMWFAMGEASTTSYFNFPAGTTNVFKGFFHAANAANQKFRLQGRDTAVIFEGGGKFPWNFFQKGIGTVYFRNKPFTTAFSTALYYYSVQGGEAGSGTAVFEVGGNVMKWLSITGDGGTIDMRVDNVLNSESSIKMVGGWQRGEMGSVLRLNRTFQTVGCIVANDGATNDYSWIEGDGATLYVTNNVTTRNSLCGLRFIGDVSLWLDTPGSMTLTNALSPTVGGIKVSRGALEFSHDAGWTNLSAIAICGSGCVKLSAKDGVRHVPAFGKETVLSLEGDGVIDIPDGVSVRVKDLFVDGVRMPRGQYGYERTSVESIRRHFTPGSSGVVNVHGEGAFSIVIR